MEFKTALINTTSAAAETLSNASQGVVYFNEGDGKIWLRGHSYYDDSTPIPEITSIKDGNNNSQQSISYTAGDEFQIALVVKENDTVLQDVDDLIHYSIVNKNTNGSDPSVTITWSSNAHYVNIDTTGVTSGSNFVIIVWGGHASYRINLNYD